MGVKLPVVLGGFSFVLGGTFFFTEPDKRQSASAAEGFMNETLSSEKNKDVLFQCIYLKQLVETTLLMTVELTACLQVFVGLIL